MPVTLVPHKRRTRDRNISAASSFIADTNSDLDFPAIEGGGVTKKAQEHVSRPIEQWTEKAKRCKHTWGHLTQPFPIQTLPLELRRMIYWYVFSAESYPSQLFQKSSNHWWQYPFSLPPICWTTESMYWETTEVFLDVIRSRFADHTGLEVFAKIIESIPNKIGFRTIKRRHPETTDELTYPRLRMVDLGCRSPGLWEVELDTSWYCSGDLIKEVNKAYVNQEFRDLILCEGLSKVVIKRSRFRGGNSFVHIDLQCRLRNLAAWITEQRKIMQKEVLLIEWEWN